MQELLQEPPSLSMEYELRELSAVCCFHLKDHKQAYEIVCILTASLIFQLKALPVAHISLSGLPILARLAQDFEGKHKSKSYHLEIVK